MAFISSSSVGSVGLGSTPPSRGFAVGDVVSPSSILPPIIHPLANRSGPANLLPGELFVVVHPDFAVVRQDKYSPNITYSHGHPDIAFDIGPGGGTYFTLANSSSPSPPNMAPPKFLPGDLVEFIQDVNCDSRQFSAGETHTVVEWDSNGFILDVSDKNDGGPPKWGFGNYHKQCLKAPEPAQKISLDSVVMDEENKQAIRAAISQIDYHELIFKTWGFEEVFEKGTAVSLLFYGPPGTGKTLTAQAIADSLDLKLKIIQTAEVESSVPGQCERNIKQFFSDAAKKKQLLLFDECDSLICDRNEVGMIIGAQINALLTALEAYTGVVVFTTNRLGRMDPAFERRVSAKVEFHMPNEEQRKAIWKRLIPEKAPIHEDVDFDLLAKFPLPGGNIKNVVLNAARTAAFLKKEKIDSECFERAIEKEVEGLKNFESAFRRQPKTPRPIRADAGVGRDGGRKSKTIERGIDKVEGDIEIEKEEGESEKKEEAEAKE